jgi:uncharacterized membrane protein
MTAGSLDAPRSTRRLTTAGLVLGVALGGFFDGVMLHQVLRWHHLLSLAPGESFRTLERQILADGLFHVLMYAIALVGLWLLWRAHDEAQARGAGRKLLIALLIGFGGWNVVDVVGFHWLAHIHRIRVDVPPDQRLGWDLLWLALFAAPPLLLAAWLSRRAGRGSGGRAGAGVAAALVLTTGLLGFRPPEDASARVVLFRPGVDPAEAMSAVAAVDGRVLWVGVEGRLLAVDLPPGRPGWALYRHGRWP